MKTAFIIHGTGGKPDENWFSWMGEQLEKRGYQVFIPEFPTPDNQSFDSWEKEFEKYEKYLSEDTIFIAHSVGPSFVCGILENLSFSVNACYFASGFLGNINIESFDILNGSFVNRDFDWEKIHENCNSFYMCHGNDDPYVPLENAQDMANKLGIEIDLIERGGHLNTETGYVSFEYLLDRIIS